MYWLKFKKFLLFTFGFVLLFLSTVFCVNAKETLPRINTTIIYDGPSSIYQKKIEPLKAEILELTSGEFDVAFKPSAIIDGQWSPEVIKTAIEKAVNSPETDFIICLGFMASNEICKYKNLKKPVIAASVLDVKIQKISSDNEKSGIKNLNFLVSTKGFFHYLEMFKKIKDFQTLTVIIDKKLASDLPFIDQFFSKKNGGLSYNIEKIYSDKTAESILSQLSEETEALLFTPSLQLPEPELMKLINRLNKTKIPGFTITGKKNVVKGLLAGVTHGTESKTILRRVALNFQQILLGEKPENLSIIFSEPRKLAINLNTAELTGIYPKRAVLEDAEIIHKTISPETGKLTLASAIDEARKNNIGLEKGRAMVSAGSADIKKARSYLIPSMEASLTGVRIDENSAKISFGTESEETLKGSLTATQVLFSEKAWSGWKAVKYAQKSREEELNTLFLDTGYETSIAYINVLRALSLERVRKDSLELTMANLKRARLRRSVGTAGASEVYRWESKLAMQKKTLLDSKAKIRQAKNNLNRILNRPLGEDFSVEEISFANPVLCVTNENFAETIANPIEYKILKAFLVKKGLEASTELKQLNAAIQAKERLTLSAKRDFFLPSVALQGKVIEVYDRNGFDDTDADPTKDRDKTSWSVAVNASFPLFTGGAKSADYIKVKEETRALKLEKNYAQAKIEERILYTIEAAKASYGAISHARDAAKAAGKNLTLVTDAYARGIVSIIELLDAQNASTLADLGEENSVYDFMADLLGLQRAIGKIDFSQPANAKQALRDAFYKYMELNS